DDAAVRAHRAENRARGETLRHRRGTGLEPDPGACPPPAATAGDSERQPGDPHHPRRWLHPRRNQVMSRRIKSLQVRLTIELCAMIARSPPADSEPSYFLLSHFGPLGQNYSGVGIRLDSAAGPLSVMVAQVSGGDQLVHSILREFIFDIAWYVPPFVALALLLATYRVRRSLRPLRPASAQARDIGP